MSTQARDRPLEVRRPVRGHQHDRREADGRLLEARWNVARRAIPDSGALVDIGRRGGRQREVGAAIHDRPAGRLDLAHGVDRPGPNRGPRGRALDRAPP